MKTKTAKLIPCREHGCDHAPFTTPQGESLHFHRVHSGNVQVKNQKRFTPPDLTANGNGNGHAAVAPVKKPKKQYKKHQAKSKPETTTKKVNFCPECGESIYHVALGMAMGAEARRKT